MKRSRTLLENGFALPSGRGNQLLWRSRSPVWDRKPNQRGNLMLPGIRSTDAQFIDFLRLISNECNKILKFDPTDEGFAGANGVTGSFDRIRTISGLGMVPLTYLPRDNDKIAKDMGLPSGFLKERHKRIFEDLIDLMWGKAKRTNFRIPKDSSSGFPFFTSDSSEKLRIANHVLKNHAVILDALLRDDVAGLAKEHAFVIAYFMGVRGQSDPPGKERFVNDFEYATTGGRSGRRFAANKQVVIDGRVIDDFSTMRMRTVCGMAMPPNILINVVQYAVRAHYAHEYAFTWHHTTHQAKLDKVRMFKYAVDLDVTQFDQSCQAWAMDHWLTQLEKYLSPGMIALYRKAHHAPYFQPSVDGIQPGRWMGNPLDGKEFTLNPGLMSGIATVSDFGKFMMVFAYLCWIDDVTQDVLEFGMSKILKGQHPKYAMLNMGDDCRLLLNDAQLRATLLKRIRDENDSKGERTTYFQFDIETGGSFIGDVIIRPNDQLELVPSIISYLDKFFVAERGIDSKFRKYWPFGYYERKVLFGKAPAYDAVEELVQWCWKQSFPEYSNINTIVDKFMDQTGLILPTAATLQDAQAMLDPDKIHYSINADDLSKETLDSLVMSIPAEEIDPVLKHLYAGEIYG